MDGYLAGSHLGPSPGAGASRECNTQRMTTGFYLVTWQLSFLPYLCGSLGQEPTSFFSPFLPILVPPIDFKSDLLFLGTSPHNCTETFTGITDPSRMPAVSSCTPLHLLSSFASAPSHANHWIPSLFLGPAVAEWGCLGCQRSRYCLSLGRSTVRAQLLRRFSDSLGPRQDLPTLAVTHGSWFVTAIPAQRCPGLHRLWRRR